MNSHELIDFAKQQFTSEDIESALRDIRLAKLRPIVRHAVQQSICTGSIFDAMTTAETHEAVIACLDDKSKNSVYSTAVKTLIREQILELFGVERCQSRAFSNRGRGYFGIKLKRIEVGEA